MPIKKEKIKRLYRSEKEKVFGGVCGGIAEYFKLDPVLIRAITILLLFLSCGAIILAYLVLWIIIPLKK